MSLVADRRCDGCGAIVERSDVEWWSLTPPGWDGEDVRLDFCDLKCLKKWARTGRIIHGECGMTDNLPACEHNCVCRDYPGPWHGCRCGVYADAHGDWCANENCRALLAERTAGWPTPNEESYDA